MTANKQPIFTGVPEFNFAVISAANTKSDGTGTIGTDIFKVFTSGVNGSYISKMRFNPTASVAATATAATTLRIFLSSVSSGSTTTSNTVLWAEIAAAAQTADQTTVATFPLEVPLAFALPAGWSILVTTHIANNANTAWVATVVGGDY